MIEKLTGIISSAAVLAGKMHLPEAAADSAGSLQIGNGLKWDDDKLCVDTADAVEKDNTLPVSSGVVYMEIGNIKALLNTI